MSPGCSLDCSDWAAHRAESQGRYKRDLFRREQLYDTYLTSSLKSLLQPTQKHISRSCCWTHSCTRVETHDCWRGCRLIWGRQDLIWLVILNMQVYVTVTIESEVGLSLYSFSPAPGSLLPLITAWRCQHGCQDLPEKSGNLLFIIQISAVFTEALKLWRLPPEAKSCQTIANRLSDCQK